MDDQNFREWFRAKLQNGIATITFEKMNGEMREMRCTLDVVYDEDPSITEYVEKPNQPVWDVDAEGWRSFRWETLISYKFDQPEPTELEAVSGM